MIKPTEVNILGVVYKIAYVEKASDVDIYRRTSLWGQIDYWTRTIRVLDGGRTAEDILQTLVHEILHGVASELHLKCLDANEHHDELDILALALADIMTRNGWLKDD